MSRQTYAGVAAAFQFTIYGPDGVSKLEGIAGRLLGEVTIDTVGGAVIDADIIPTIAEQAGAAGDYYASFSVPAGAQVGRSYFLTVRDPDTGYDVQETFTVKTSDAAALTSQMLGTPY